MLGSVRVVADLSWGQVDTVVLDVVTEGGREAIIKASGPDNHHLDRELDAHDGWTAPLEAEGLAARLVGGNRAQRIAILEYLPGRLAEGTADEHSADFHRAAGRALRILHSGAVRVDDEYAQRTIGRALRWLDGEHRIDPALAEIARTRLGSAPTGPRRVVPTHGDWQPRNWLTDGGTFRLIDFGRFAFRPAETDLCRLQVQQWRTHPALADAFLSGYGADPRASASWETDLLCEAVGTACWAFQVGDEPFEAQGHRMLHDALAL